VTTKTKVTALFNTTLERAFKTPMLCDVTKVHTGFLIMPKVTHCSNDETWGTVGGTRKVFMSKTAAFKGGEAALDKVLERKELAYWKIEISGFKYWMLGFSKFEGEWFTQPLPDGTIQVQYIYTMFSGNKFLYPLHWIFTKTFWNIYMKRVVRNIQQLAANNEPYLYA